MELKILAIRNYLLIINNKPVFFNFHGLEG
jgi:hypothetical protein